MSALVRQVHEFHEVYGCDSSPTPTVGSIALRKLRYDLIAEELHEFAEAAGATWYADELDEEPYWHFDGEGLANIVDMADALGDLLYVVQGAMEAFGFPAEMIVEAIHRSNMSKLGEDGKPIVRADGKILKGPNFFPPEPEIARVLGL